MASSLASDFISFFISSNDKIKAIITITATTTIIIII